MHMYDNCISAHIILKILLCRVNEIFENATYLHYENKTLLLVKKLNRLVFKKMKICCKWK